MRIAIIGGTGTLGRHVARELRALGHDVRALSRSTPSYRVDLTTGTGLESALAGCDVVVDASNDSSRRAADTLVEGSKRLLAAEQAAGVQHHVCVSVIGCEHVPVGYFRLKFAQERVVEQGSIPWSIVRATQFHELLETALSSASRWGVLPLPRVPVQTVACAEVARTVAHVATGEPLRRRMEVAGPEVVDLRKLARTWRSLTGRRTLLLPLPLPGRIGTAMRSGALTAVQPDVSGRIQFATWMKTGEFSR